jgi:hypothetical protein
VIDENEVGQYANSLPEDGDDAAAGLLELGGMRAPPGVGGQSMEEEHYGSDQDSDIDESFPRGGRGGQEGSTTNKAARDRIDNVANSYNGSTAWAYATRKDDFPPNRNKCNKFVCDVLQEAGAPISVHVDGQPRCARAEELANPGWNPKGWRQLGPGEAPQPGDVAAYRLEGEDRTEDGSGHTGIITSGGVGNMSAHHNDVRGVTGQFGSNSQMDRISGVIYRRYVGE